jgi:soluble lytic murein transglycosylase-like protein
LIKLILSPLISCLLATTPSPSDLQEYIACRKIEKTIFSVSDWQPLIEEYFKPEDVARAMRIIYCESSGRPRAVGVNKDGTKDVGLWQFNDNTWAWLKPKLRISSPRTDPRVSTAVASWLVYNDGWYHWNSSKNCWKENK